MRTGPWGTKSPGCPPRLPHCSRALNSLYFISPFICPAHAGLHCVRISSRYTEVSTLLWKSTKDCKRKRLHIFYSCFRSPLIQSNLTVKLQLHYTFYVKLQASNYDILAPWGGVKEGLRCAFMSAVLLLFLILSKNNEFTRRMNNTRFQNSYTSGDLYFPYMHIHTQNKDWSLEA